jgi:hypothetical protein
MERMRNSFSKELKDVTEKLAASEAALEELKQLRS